MKKYLITTFVVLLLGSGCKYFSNKKPDASERVIARVLDEFLYLSDVQPLVQGVSATDSAKLVAAYADSWVKKRLLYKKAQEYIAQDDIGIEKKVEAYRQSLTLYEYEKELVLQKLDKAVSDDEINAYYEKNKANYILDNDVFLVNYIVISPQVEDFEKVKPLFNKQKNEDEMRALEGYCKAFAKMYNISDGVWKTGNGMTADFLMKENEIGGLYKSELFREFKKDGLNYYIKIEDIKRSGEPTPLLFIKDQIKEMLVNKKKVVLIDNIYDRILEEGKKKQQVEIFVK